MGENIKVRVLSSRKHKYNPNLGPADVLTSGLDLSVCAFSSIKVRNHPNGLGFDVVVVVTLVVLRQGLDWVSLVTREYICCAAHFTNEQLSRHHTPICNG